MVNHLGGLISGKICNIKTKCDHPPPHTHTHKWCGCMMCGGKVYLGKPFDMKGDSRANI